MSASRERVVLVLASANSDKAMEMAEILTGALPPGFELRARPADLDDIEEDGDTLEDNARLKAAAVRRATGLGAIADDTGLEVDALSGRPGVRTARFAGPQSRPDDNIDLLLSELEGVGDRRARFRTVALAALADGRELAATGTLEGTIGFERRGDGGFGYDPVFVPDGAGGRTLAELDGPEKHAISHRGRAFRSLARQLAALGAPTADSK